MNKILCREARQTLVAMLLMLLAAGCGRNPYFKVMNCSMNQTIAPSAELPVKYKASVSIDYPMVKGDTMHVATAFRNLIVSNALGWEYDSLDVETASKVYMFGLLEDFRAIAEQMQFTGMYNGGAGSEVIDWFDSVNGYFAGSNGKFSSYMVERSSYSGGDYTESAALGIVFDLHEGRQVTLDDIFKPDAFDTLCELISRHAPECMPDGVAETLSLSSIPPTGNYVLTGKSITFIYNPNEIGPYELGVIQISVPLRECQEAGIFAEGVWKR